MVFNKFCQINASNINLITLLTFDKVWLYDYQSFRWVGLISYSPIISLKCKLFKNRLALNIYTTFSLDRKSRQKDQVVAAPRLHF